MNPVCLLFDHIGPYHEARIAAAAAVLPVVAVEVFGRSHDYCWKSSRPEKYETLFPDRIGLRVSALARRMNALLERIQPGVVVIPGWWEKSALAALAWSVRNARRVVFMSDSRATDKPRNFFPERIKKQLVELGSSALVAGAAHADYLHTLGLSRSVIFDGYDVVDNDYFAARAADARRDAEATRLRLRLPENYFLASSRFIAKKNLARLIEAYALYRNDAGPRAWKLIILGDGELRGDLEARIKRLHLKEAIVLPGFLDYAELPAYYALAGDFVHASTSDQWGLVVNEAMACGLPVLVSTGCGCSPELVRDNVNGFTFDPADVPALARLLGRIASTDCAAMGAASRTIIAAWSPQRFAAQLRCAVFAALDATPRRVQPMQQWLLQACLHR